MTIWRLFALPLTAGAAASGVTWALTRVVVSAVEAARVRKIASVFENLDMTTSLLLGIPRLNACSGGPESHFPPDPICRLGMARTPSSTDVSHGLALEFSDGCHREVRLIRGVDR